MNRLILFIMGIFQSHLLMSDASPDHQSHLTLGGGGEERGCDSRPFGISLHNLRSYMSASAGKRTWAFNITYRLTHIF